MNSTPSGGRAFLRDVLIILIVASAFLAAGCTHQSASLTGAPPDFLLGHFVDDYDNLYEISATNWIQPPHGEYVIVRWDPAGQYAIARNGDQNTSEPGLWTRIDWMRLEGMAPYGWAYCYTAYDAPNAAAAESAKAADRSAPKTGCNGFPFSRMKRAVRDTTR